MTPPLQLHRSLIFWAGLVAMGFVAWAWWDSTRRETHAGYDRFEFRQAVSQISLTNGRKTQYRVPTAEGGIRFEEAPTELIREPGFSDGFIPESLPAPYFLRWDRDSDQEVLPPALPATYRDIMASRMTESRSNCWLLSIPHWCLLAGVAVPWLGLLALRAQWRKRERAKAFAPRPPERETLLHGE